MQPALALTSELEIPQGTVRPEYLRLSDDLIHLSAAFRLDLPDVCHQQARVFVVAIECVDRLLDNLPTAQERRRFADSVIAFLAQENDSQHEASDAELIHRLAQLRDVIYQERIAPIFISNVKCIFANAETMRDATRVAHYVNCVHVEGRLMMELLLLLLQPHTSARFDNFMRRIATPANLIDKMRDAALDYQHGELKIRPCFLFQLCLHTRFIAALAPLICLSLMNPNLLRWGWNSLRREWLESFAH